MKHLHPNLVYLIFGISGIANSVFKGKEDSATSFLAMAFGTTMLICWQVSEGNRREKERKP